MKVPVLLLIGSCCLASPAWAIYRCTDANGSTVYQDAPCTGPGVVIEVRPATGTISPPPPHAEPPVAQPAAPTPPPREPEPAVAPVATKTQLELDADQCLNWYRPRLRDPRGAYYTHPTRDKRVVTIDLHATNGYGGYVVKAASCEILAGKLNEAWTREHARRGGWAEE
jgi:hypothetical protein